MTPSTPPQVRLERDPDRIVVTGPHAGGTVYLHGAHVGAYQPAGGEPVLYMSALAEFGEGKAIRGGVPICFPWFGPPAPAPGTGSGPDAPMHGLVRTQIWDAPETQIEDETVHLIFTRQVELFALTYRVSIGQTLAMTLTVRNTGPAPATFEAALHTYLAVSDVRQIEIAGLAGATYIDKVHAMQRTVQDDQPIRFTGEVDRVYLDTAAACTLRDPGLGRSIAVEKENARSTIVWNPWIAKAATLGDLPDDAWQRFVCIESGNVADNAVELPAGKTHEMTATVRVG